MFIIIIVNILIDFNCSLVLVPYTCIFVSFGFQVDVYCLTNWVSKCCSMSLRRFVYTKPSNSKKLCTKFSKHFIHAFVLEYLYRKKLPYFKWPNMCGSTCQRISLYASIKALALVFAKHPSFFFVLMVMLRYCPTLGTNVVGFRKLYPKTAHTCNLPLESHSWFRIWNQHQIPSSFDVDVYMHLLGFMTYFKPKPTAFGKAMIVHQVW